MISIVKEPRTPSIWVDLLILINITNTKISNKKEMTIKFCPKETLYSLREIKRNKMNFS